MMSENVPYENFEPHPLCELVPSFSPLECEALEWSLSRRNGLADDPIVIFEGRILDGRHRYAVAKRLGIRMREEYFVDFGGTHQEAFDFVCQRLTHRHMSVVQRAALAVNIFLPLELDAAQTRQKAGDLCDGGRKGRASDLAGQRLAVSGRSVEKVARIQKQNPDIFEDMLAGQFSSIADAERCLERLNLEVSSQEVPHRPRARSRSGERSEQALRRAASRLVRAVADGTFDAVLGAEASELCRLLRLVAR